MMDNNTPITEELLQKILVTIGIVTGFWKFVDAFFGLLHKRQRGFVSDIVKEELKGELQALKEDIQEIKKDREEDSRYQVKQFQKIMDILNK